MKPRIALALALGLAMSARVATAAPGSPDARAAFDKGVAAYKTGNFVGASDALEKSFKLEADPDTLFAWAQSERKLSHCDKAIPLYERLLKFDMPSENKAAISANLAECKALVPAKQPEPEPEAKRTDAKRQDTKKQAVAEKRPDVEPIDIGPPPVRPPVESRPWWKDPVGDGLVVVGLVGIGVGAGMLVSASSLDSQATNTNQTTNYFEYQKLRDQANSRSKLGIISGGAGAALLVTGVVWYATHRDRQDRQVVGWLDATSGGLGVAGAW